MSLVNEVNSLLFAISPSAGELQASSVSQVHVPFCVGVHRCRLGWDGVKCRDSKESPRLHSPFHPAKCLKCHLIPKTVTAVIISFARAKGAELHQKVKEVVAVDPYTVRFVLPEPWPDFMTFYGTLASAASWITPKKYFERQDGFKRKPIGLGPYKFVSTKPGRACPRRSGETARLPGLRWLAATPKLGGPCGSVEEGSLPSISGSWRTIAPPAARHWLRRQVRACTVSTLKLTRRTSGLSASESFVPPTPRL